ncbi:MAG: helix-turn-helix domain-containing protein [Acidobacteriaceae bacterium]
MAICSPGNIGFAVIALRRNFDFSKRRSKISAQVSESKIKNLGVVRATISRRISATERLVTPNYTIASGYVAGSSDNWRLNTRYLKANLSVEALAERIGMSPRHFSRVCLREMKMNPGQFGRLRVEAAQQMIDSSSMGLKETADACDFGSTDSMRRKENHRRTVFALSTQSVDANDETAITRAIRRTFDGVHGEAQHSSESASYQSRPDQLRLLR